MTPEEIIEGKSLCAEFMGYKKIKDLEEIDEENEHLKDCWFLPYTTLVFWDTENLKFDSDWNWLMEIVKVIKEDKKILPMNGIPDSTTPWINAISPINKALLTTDITLVFKAVVQYIKWSKEIEFHKT